MTCETKNRNATLDILKGILIFAVCLIHIAYNWGANIFVEVMFPCFLGIFFLVSGYFYKEEYSFLETLKKKFLHLVVPGICYTFITSVTYYLYLKMTNCEAFFSDVLECVWTMFVDLQSLKDIVYVNNPELWEMKLYYYIFICIPIWYLFRLFFSYIIFKVVANYGLSSNKRYMLVTFSLLSVAALYQLLVPIHMPFILDNCIALAAFLLTGAYIKKKEVVKYIEANYKTLKWWIILFVILICYIFLYRFESFGRYLVIGSFGKYKAVSIYLCFITTMCDAYLAYVFAMILGKLKYVRNIFSMLGKESLTILCMHHTFAFMIAAIFGFETSMTNTENVFIVQRGLNLISSIALCLGLSCMIKKVKNLIKNRYEQKIKFKERKI